MFDYDPEVSNFLRARNTGNWVDYEYLNLVNDVLNNGVLKPTRAKIDGKNISAYSVFGRQARFSLAEGFPILTTKKVNFDAIVHELIWFLSGSSNIKYLRDNNVHIWDQWASPEGDLGYGTYGTLWRMFPFFIPSDEYMIEDNKYEDHYIEDKWGDGYIEGYVDQIGELIKNIEKIKQDPTASCGRRLIVTAWNPYYVDKVGLPPCHCFVQFNVTDDKLSCHLYQRSADLFLGVPFNISSYALLTNIIAHITGLNVGEFVHTFGDLHIYENLVDQCKEQLMRSPYKLPTLSIREGINSVDDLVREDFTLVDYQCHPAIRGQVAV